MTNPKFVMDLGLGGRRYRDLDVFERFVWAERLRAFCIFPTSSAERECYLACKSAHRIYGLESEERYGIPRELQRYREANGARYLKEERQFFSSVGGMGNLLHSYGLDIYGDYERISTIQCWHLMRIATNLMQLQNTPDLHAPGSLAKAVGMVTDSYPAKSRNEVHEEEDTDEIVRKPKVQGITGGNEKYLLKLWRHHKSALPICIAYGMMFLLRYSEACTDPETSEFHAHQIYDDHFDPYKNAFYTHSDGVIPAYLTAAQFFTTHTPHSQKEPFLRPGEYWGFTSGFTGGTSPVDPSMFGPLVDVDLSRVLSHRAPTKRA